MPMRFQRVTAAPATTLVRMAKPGIVIFVAELAPDTPNAVTWIVASAPDKPAPASVSKSAADSNPAVVVTVRDVWLDPEFASSVVTVDSSGFASVTNEPATLVALPTSAGMLVDAIGMV